MEFEKLFGALSLKFLLIGCFLYKINEITILNKLHMFNLEFTNIFIKMF